MLEPLIIKILTNTIGFQHYVLEPLKILTNTIGFQHYVLEPLNIAASSNHRGSSLKGVTF